MSPVNRRPPRRGGVAVWVLVCLAVLLGVVAVGTDGGRMMDERQRVQAAADAAALAAAGDLYENYYTNQGTDPLGTARAAALATAAANGYANDGTASVVTVNIPPQSGPFAGQADHAEVLITSNLDAGFARALGRSQLPVRARAVARGRPMKVGVLALQPTGPGALQISGSGDLAVNGPVVVDSTDPAAWTNSTNGTVKADPFQIVGGYQNTGSVTTSPIQLGVQPTPDPLRTFPQPDPATFTLRSASTLTVSSDVTLLPGVYRGGITSLGGTITLQPGVYILDGGGLSLSGNGSLTGSQVMIFNTGGAAAGPISLSGTATVSLTAPTTGTYAGVVIFQDRSVTAPLTVTGNATLQVGGVVYAPAAAVTVWGSGLVTPSGSSGGVIAQSLTVGGNGSVTIDPGTNRPKVPEVRLVD